MSRSVVLFVAAASLAAGAHAQTAPSRSGGLAGLLGGGVPNIGSVGAGNAAGLLGYCVKNNLLGGLAGAAPGVVGNAPRTAAADSAVPTGARGVLERLAGRQDVRTSPGYAAGQAGRVQTGGGRALSLDGLQGQVKTRVCDLVLNRARSFL